MIVRLSGPRCSRTLPSPDRRLLRARARRLLAAVGRADAELSVTLADDATMAALNGVHRGRPRPTDVLSFSLLEGEHARFAGPLLGDVVIGLEAAARQADVDGRTLDDEVARLLIHGMLHLLGHDHEQREEARRMRAEERRLAKVLAT